MLPVIDELTRDRSRISLVEANHVIYELIKSGFRTRTPDSDQGERINLVRIVK